MIGRRDDVLSALHVSAPRLRARDLLSEAARTTLHRPLRSILTGIGTLLGAAAFVATLGISATAAAQISADFDTYRTTQVLVRPVDPQSSDTAWYGETALSRLRDLNGVVSAGSRLTGPDIEVAGSLSGEGSNTSVRLVGATPSALSVIEPHLVAGRTFDEFHEDSASPVVLLSRSVAEALGLSRTNVAVFVGGRPLTVIGIYDNVRRSSDVLLSIIVPYSLGELMSAAVEREVMIETSAGAAAMIAGQARSALRPEGPDALDVVAAPDPSSFRRGIESDVRSLSLLLAVVISVVGLVSIMNATTATMLTRVSEIGLRRAVGARARHIFAQVLAEGAALGVLGAWFGTLLGVALVLGVSLAQGWAPVLDLWLAVSVCLGGAAIGLLGGLLPAVRAIRISPVDALRR